MRLRFIHPHPNLKPFIKGYYYIELDCIPDKPLDIHPIGYNTIAFTFNPGTAFRSNNGLNYNFNLSYHGYISKHISLIPLQSSIKMVVVSFQTTGTSQLFGIYQPDLVNQIIQIDDVITDSYVLKNRLAEDILCENKIISLIESWLLKKVSTKKESRYVSNINYACQLIKANYGNLRIDNLCYQINMSQTNLEEYFKQMIGITPKHYCRIIRFIAAYRYILNHTHIEWSEVVYRYNFFDQSHFIRDFKTFFGYSPSKIHLANSRLAKGLFLNI